MKNLLPFLLVFTVIAGYSQEPASRKKSSCSDPRTLPVLWQQTSAEYRALCYQAFNLATLRIREIPAKEARAGNLAIVTDLDETILDNSCGEAQDILDRRSYSSAGWKEWTKMHAATALPGAAEFLRYAHSWGITIFYITNRDTSEAAGTLENLKQLSLPNADDSHLLLMAGISSKEDRRQRVMQKYRIVMLLGDNLNDFASVFEKKPVDERKSETDRVKDEWGGKFIVLPNSTYGEWENALYGYRHGLRPEEKDSLRYSHLQGFRGK
ncbi:MAG TPA: 5'-nucleotidase, lipoprotein e(P4) family [Bacteroidales bacterium]|nr:5'-nucleotidase, lipoprotein e(P4) family [Bacteroidales bacterium]